MRPLLFVARWAVALVGGAVAAGLLLGLAVLAAGDAGPAASLGLLALGFGLAFFPAVLVTGTDSPRPVLRRAAVVYALEGALLAAGQAYRLLTGRPVLTPQQLGWVQSAADLGQSLTGQVAPLAGAVAGAFVLLASLVFYLALRGPGAPAAAPGRAVAAAEPQPRSAGRAAAPTPAPARPPTQPAGSPKVLPDEDTQLMADLEKLRKRLPQMGKEE